MNPAYLAWTRQHPAQVRDPLATIGQSRDRAGHWQRLALNRSALEVLGEPEALMLTWIARQRLLVLRIADRAEPGALALHYCRLGFATCSIAAFAVRHGFRGALGRLPYFVEVYHRGRQCWVVGPVPASDHQQDIAAETRHERKEEEYGRLEQFRRSSDDDAR